MGFVGPPKILFMARGALLIALFLRAQANEAPCDTEIANTLKSLFTPQKYPSIQLQALRRDVLRRVEDVLDKTAEEDLNYQRSLSALPQWGGIPLKRNLEALARAGLIHTLPQDDPEDNIKRSIANLAKNGQLPTYQNNESKRGIESLARNGELTFNRKEVQQLLDELYSKRNIGSLARNYNFPTYEKRFLGSLARNNELNFGGKRNVASLAREGSRVGGKRNVAALLRQDNYSNGQSDDFRTETPQFVEDKRNIASIKAQYPGAKYKRSVKSRAKRQADYFEGGSEEFSAPVFQNQNVYDYEELIRELTGAYPNTEKRFLGSVVKSGWFRPTSARYNRYESPEKRHIGSLARLGWLPTIRNVRRFNRSGRSSNSDECRATSTNGQTQDNPISQNAVPLEDKRFLLQPAVDHLLLRKLYKHPRTHAFISNMS